MSPYLCLIISLCCIAIGDVLAKKWVLLSNPHFLVLALLCYLCGSITYMPLMKFKGLIISTLLWALGTLAVGIFVGLGFGEHLNPAQIVGMILGVVSVILLCL